MNRLLNSLLLISLAAIIFVSPLAILAQTKIKAPRNFFGVETDVQAGQNAAMEAERQLPMLNDPMVNEYVFGVGRRLVQAIPPEFQIPQFRYSFKVVNAKDLNAFALPGGFTYINRGMIEACKSEGEMAGVMAHEISHVALRHGTAQASKAYMAQAGLGVLGAILGGGTGAAVAQQVSGLGLSVYFLKFSREYETQSDILGSHIMARAGYDPRDLANVFRTIERASGGSGGPQFLSSHPNPGNRYERINKEAQMLRVTGNAGNSGQFQQVVSRLRGTPSGRNVGDISRSGDNRYPTGNARQGRVEYPSTRYRSYNQNLYRVSVPENWRELPSQGTVTYAPEGAYGNANNQFVFTHGIQLGVANLRANDLRSATQQFVDSLLQSNSYLRQSGGYQRGTLGGRQAMRASLSGESDLTGRTEIVYVYTRLLSNGDLFYVISVAPREDFNSYQRAFDTVVRSVEIRD